MSIKLITEQLLLGGPRAGSLDRLHLFVPGELPRQRLTFCRRIVVFASPNNPGALEVAKDLALATDNCIEVTSDETNAMITHFLLYLNDQTYLESAGKELAEEIRRARAVRETWRSTIEIVMVHENDPERGGCEFGIFFDGRTPKDLEDSGVYNVRTLYYYVPSVRVYVSYHLTPRVPLASQVIAQALYSGRFWPVSAAVVAKAMGATIATGSRPRSFTTTSALRTELRHSTLSAAVQRGMRNCRDKTSTAAEARRVRKASFLYGWHSDGAQATTDRPGREFLRGPGSASAQSRRDTTTESLQSSASSRGLEPEPLGLEPWARVRSGVLLRGRESLGVLSRSTLAALEQATAEHAGSSEIASSDQDPGPSMGVETAMETARDPESLLAVGPMQSQPMQTRVGYPTSLPRPRRPLAVRV